LLQRVFKLADKKTILLTRRRVIVANTFLFLFHPSFFFRLLKSPAARETRALFECRGRVHADMATSTVAKDISATRKQGPCICGAFTRGRLEKQKGAKGY
jgi:hypothetical protein